jgi:hypothetical protein
MLPSPKSPNQATYYTH